ncbi:cell division protein FtsL [Priestia abyssalis]|uniref:cell division protein FtsL n=1 Tax=Priestia abyssalis TaxID=1221450 RepID=UPI000995D793|nr:cell division protein FtsL [Priestia abyssalis]
MGNLAYQVREKQNEQQKQVQKVRKKKKFRFSVGEKVLYAGFFIGVVFGSVQIVSNQVSLYDVNADIQALESKISSQERANNELKLQVVELSTYERIWAKAKELGLDLNENNVKVVQD